MLRNDTVLQMYINLMSKDASLTKYLTLDEFSEALLNVEFNTAEDFAIKSTNIIHNLLITCSAKRATEQLGITLVRGY